MYLIRCILTGGRPKMVLLLYIFSRLMTKNCSCLLLLLLMGRICSAQHDTIRPAYLIFDTAVVVAKPADTLSPFLQKATNGIKKTLHYLSFTQYNDRKVDRPVQGPDAYAPIRGKKINTITIKILKPFGVDIEDPDNYHPTKLQTFANKMQSATRSWVIRNELLFSEGDTVNPLAFSDTERNLWLKETYKDIKFEVTPVDGNAVDIVIYVRDRWNWSLSTNVDFRRLTTGPIFSNMFGFPQQLGVAASFNYRLDNPYTVVATYLYSNVLATHIDASITGRFDNLQRGVQVLITRPFFSGKTVWAGHIAGTYYDERYTVLSPEGPAVLAPNRINTQDFWIARTFDLPGQLSVRHPLYKLITAVRMIRIDYPQRPYIYNTDGTIGFLNSTTMIGGIGFAQWDYYVDHNIYSLVQAEYFPKGLSGAILGGYQEDEILQRRTYVGAALQYGYYFKNLGYFLSQFKYGGFPVLNNYSQLLVDWRNTFYTIHERVGRASLRQIFNLYGRWGYDQPFGRNTYVDNFTGLRGLYTNQLRGNTTYAFDYEVDFFAPKKILGFNSSMFVFADFALIQQTIKENAFQSGMGVGFRFRNVNLNIDFIQLMIAYYPGLNIPYQPPYNLLGSSKNDRQLQNRDLYEPTILTVN
jgi:hypothetical protein